MIKTALNQYESLKQSLGRVHLHVCQARQCYHNFLHRNEKTGHHQVREAAEQFSAAIDRASAALLPFEPVEVNLESLIEESRKLFEEMAVAHSDAKAAVATWSSSGVCDNRLAEAVGVEGELGWAARQAEEIYRFAVKAAFLSGGKNG